MEMLKADMLSFNNNQSKSYLNKKMKKAIFLKMIINYLQIMSLSKEINLDWSYTIRMFYEAQTRVGDVSDQIFSFDCLLANYSQDIIYLKLILIVFLPAMLSTILMIFYIFLKKLKKIPFTNYLINSLVITYFLLQPIVISICFIVLSCKEIDPNQYLISTSLITECYSDAYYYYVI